MKGKDKYILYILMATSLVLGYFIVSEKYDSYSDIITFLSIIIGFEITSLSVIFDNPIKDVLRNRKINLYKTELHRLRDFYNFSILTNIISVLIILLTPEFNYQFEICNYLIKTGNYLFVLPILICTVYCFLRLLYDLLQIFVYPINFNGNE